MTNRFSRHLKEVHKAGKYTSRKNSKGELLGFKTLIKPSKEKVFQHYKKVAEIINTSKSLNINRFIGKLSPIIIGWCNYYSTVISKEVFAKLAFPNLKVELTTTKTYRYFIDTAMIKRRRLTVLMNRPSNQQNYHKGGTGLKVC